MSGWRVIAAHKVCNCIATLCSRMPHEQKCIDIINHRLKSHRTPCSKQHDHWLSCLPDCCKQILLTLRKFHGSHRSRLTAEMTMESQDKDSHISIPRRTYGIRDTSIYRSEHIASLHNAHTGRESSIETFLYRNRTVIIPECCPGTDHRPWSRSERTYKGNLLT